MMHPLLQSATATVSASPGPAVIAITSTQLVLGLILSVGAVAGIAYRLGLISQSQKDAHSNMTTMVNGLTLAIQDGLAGVMSRLDQAEKYQQETDVKRENWNGWRTVVDTTLTKHDGKIETLTKHLPR